MAVDKLVDSAQLNSDLTSIANAIRTKGGTSAQLEFPDDFIDAINAISGGGGGDDADEKDVNFIDYDGKILYSYTAQEFANLSAMPANPSHDGLTAEGWNWTLADAKAYVASNGCLVIGQMYVTNDGKTRFYISIPADKSYRTLTIRFTQSKANGVTFNWGDGSATESFSGTSPQDVTHTYSASGDYVVTLAPGSDCNLSFIGSSSNTILGPSVDSRIMQECLKKVEFGSNVKELQYCFYNLSSLESVTFPKTVTRITDCLNESHNITGLVIPSSVTWISTFTSHNLRYVSLPKTIATYSTSFTSCDKLRMICFPLISSVGGSLAAALSLRRVSIPEGVTTIGGSFCQNARCLHSITFPSTITNMNSYNILSVAGAIEEIHMKPTSPPSLGGNFLANVSTSVYKIYVPYSADHSILNNYKTASNWSSKASYIQEEPQ